MLTERTSVGLDIHARWADAAAIDGVTDGLIQTRLKPSNDYIRSWLLDLLGPVAVAYEAGTTGSGRPYRWPRQGSDGFVAPSTPGRPSGDRVKIDAKDMLCIWRGCCGLMSTPRYRSRASIRSRPATWSAHVRTHAST